MLGCVPTTAKNDRAPVPFNGTHKRNTMNRTVNRRAATLAFALTLTFAQVAGAQSPAAPPSEPAAAAPARAKVACNECGVVRSVKLVEKKGSSSGVGAVAGGVLGGLLGHQIGSGHGQDLATGIGAVGGAAVGANVGRAHDTPYTQDVQRCENVASAGSVDYWDVTYNFRGYAHHVQTTSPPGRTILVNAEGEPRI